MTRDESWQRLEQFFGCYFHEDWALEAKSTEEVVHGFAASAPPGHMALLAQDVAEFAASNTDDEELRRVLFEDLGCYYDPAADGVSPRVWLNRLAEMLQKMA